MAGRGGGRLNHRNRPSTFHPTPQQQPQPPPQQQPFDPNFLLLHNLNQMLQNPYLQNHNFPPQNPNFVPQNPNYSPNFPPQNPNFLQNQNYIPPQNPNPSSSNSSQEHQHHLRPDGVITIRPQKPPKNKFPLPQPRKNNAVSEQREKIDAAVVAVRREMVAGGKEHVSSWKVSQAALVRFKADSWETLGFQMQEIPSLRQLLFIEGKINAFIHCHVAAHKITSLFDLQEALCKNEGVEKFEELELGPFLMQPLVIHYFSISNGIDEVYEITAEKIVSHLAVYLYRKPRDANIEELLDFIANKCKVTSKEKLGVRIQSLGMHIGMICKARGAQNQILKKFTDNVKEKCSKQKKKRPLFSLQKKELDERFSDITQRVSSFASVHKDFSGQHLRFSSSSSDEIDDVTERSDSEDNSTSKQNQSSIKSKSGDKVSSCPYPSVAEEISRLGLRGDTGEASSPSDQICEPAAKKRKVKCQSHGKTVARISKRLLSVRSDLEICGIKDPNNDDASLNEDSIRMFITTWKDACREHAAAEVFEKMLHVYKMKKGQKNKLRKAFSSYPLVGLLNVAVTSIKRGMWDSMYDTFQLMTTLQQESTQDDELTNYENIDIEPTEKGLNIFEKGESVPDLCVNVEDVLTKASEYLDGNVVLSGGTSLLDRVLMFVEQISRCELWLARQFSVGEFKMLGHGEFWSFLGKNRSLFPKELLNFLTSEVGENHAFEVSMIQQQLAMLLSQALGSLWEDDVVTKENLLELLTKQFPLISFKTSKHGGMKDLLDSVRQHSSVTSTCVIFSATLLGTSTYSDPAQNSKSEFFDCSKLITCNDHKGGYPTSRTSRDAIEVLRRAPFLSDLNSWSHWDSIYAPSLGPLMEWLLTEVNVKDLVCLVTRHGKIIRVDHSASGEMMLQALVQESSFQVAVQLLSLFTLSGGRRHVPLSLLKCQTRQGFEVIISNPVRNMGLGGDQRNVNMFGRLGTSGCDSSMDLAKNLIEGDRVLGPALRVVIDCLTFLPSEFRCFAADVLLSGLRSLVKDVNSAVLVQCKGTEERLMLHEVGFGLGIIEWIDDHHALCPLTDNYSSVQVGESAFISAGLDGKSSGCALISSSEPPFSADNRDEISKHDSDKSSTLSIKLVNNSEIAVSNQSSEQNINEEEAALIIESIRREEFGLDSSLSDAENGMLKKQHARLGRALHCLSQELYSLDSHFLLELVQNADDNAYLDNVEPTLCFILKDTSIIILNNEQGFTAKNIRALCDVGNSTKKGSSAGYIGQKGIGFKSVFRITDAPEIHSNGFHIKFDISEGQIGFVLPTTIPPCDIQMFRRLASGGDGQKGMNCWNTCIVLPFKSTLREASGMSSISSMFLDLHPSLLLFLHRLRCIKVRNMANDTYGVMRKEVLGNGIVRVCNGEEKMTWFVASCKLCPKISRLNTHMTEISIAFTLEETVNGEYKPVLAQQPVFAFLPLRAYGLKFILQADFILPSSREEVDGDNPWNQWLLSEFPSLFVSAEKLFCALPCFQENPAKAVNAYMSFVPLVGDVHGFFSGLPRLILSKLRQSNCLLQDGSMDKWVAPCKVLKGWNEQAQKLLPDTLLYGHLGLGLLHKDIHLSDTLARALGVEEYGPKILVQFISSVSRTKDGTKSMGLCWLISYLSELQNMLYSHAMNLRNTWLEKEQEQELINSLKKAPFIPLSNGTFGSLDEGTIWFPADYRSAGVDGDLCNLAFPCLYAKLRIVSPALFSVSGDVTLLSNCSTMLQKIGVQEMSAHELIRIHILPSIGNFQLTNNNQQLMIEYVTFVMLHLQSNCTDCHGENEHILSELRSKALILTNHGFKRPSDIPIHFSGEFGNFVDVSKFVYGLDYKWHEVDKIYLDHPATKSVSCSLMKWREFLQMLGVTDFVKLAVAEKSIADLSPVLLDQIMSDRHLISPGLVVRDWESPELVHILSLLSQDGSQEKCRHMLEILDALWDDHFSDKVLGCLAANAGPNDFFFKTSVLRCICDTKWVVSSADNELHYPGDLFYDCNDVRSILGGHVPYAVPKIKSLQLLNQIGFKTQVTLDDVLSMLQIWSRSKSAFTASLSQMSKLYSFIWQQMATGRQQAVDVFKSGPFIFVPGTSVKFHEDVVAGVLLSPEEVYWCDPTGALEHSDIMDSSISIPLISIYSGLHDFFVKECGVNEAPAVHHYLQILQQLSKNTSPHQSANTVFQILLKWSDGLSCGVLSPDDFNSLKECLSQLEFTVLPTLCDKWVSLHPDFGLVCWCDDDDLKHEYKSFEEIEFLYFGELTDIEKEMLQTKVSALLKNLGIPALSEVVTREVFYKGCADSGVITSMIGWILPFAQRYLYNLHREIYCQLKLSGFSALHDLRVIVVHELYYHNDIKKCKKGRSKKQFKCKSLLQGNILYTTCLANSEDNPDYHSVFMELSRLFFDGTPKSRLDESQLANFLLMVIRESSSSDESVELILNRQNMVKLPVEDSVWSLSSPLPLLDNEEVPPENCLSQDPNTPKSKKKLELSSWPPAGWKTAPGFSYARRNGIRTRAPTAEKSGNPGTNDGNFQGGLVLNNEVTSAELDNDTVIEDDGVVEPGTTLMPFFGYQADHFSELPQSSMEAMADPTNIFVESICPEDGPSKSSWKNLQLLSTPGAQRAVLTGRQGERVAYKYFAEKFGEKTVNWVNQDEETGSPYDIVIGDDEDSLEYIEVKSSQYARKGLFEISTGEWQFAAEMGDSYSVAHVILSGQNLAKIVVFKNLLKLCQQKKLQLAILIPKTYQETSQ